MACLRNSGQANKHRKALFETLQTNISVSATVLEEESKSRLNLIPATYNYK